MAQTKTDARPAVPTSAPRGTAASRWAALVYALFFLSGLTSLIYEVIWVRQFGLVFGVTTYAVSTVLAAFFAGLALGSYAAGRIIDRGRLQPLFVYGLMEGVVGVYAVLLPFLLKSVEHAYPAVYSHLGESFTLFTLFRFVVSFAVLVIPTTLMGATLPVLSKLLVDREDELGLGVGRLYAINTTGAVAGSVAAGYILIARYGVPNTLLIAACGNFLLAVAAVLMSRCSVFRAATSRAEKEEKRPLERSDRVILALAFTCGLAILALEVVWTKSLVLILGSTTYAFATMLTAVLIGIALGSAVFAGTADAAQNRGALVAGLVFFGGLCAAAGPLIINRLPFVFLRLWDWTYGVFELLIVAQFIICFLLVFVPTFLSGAIFPILVRMHSHGVGRVGRTVADVYSVNTFGGILGSLLGGFVLVKFLGLATSMIVAALLLMAVGGLLAISLAKPWSRGRRTAVGLVMVAAVVLVAVFPPRFDTKLLFGGWGPFIGGEYTGRNSGSTVDTTDRNMMRMRYHREGVSASVDVFESGYGTQSISINAQPVATTYMPDMRALQMLGHLPVLLHPDPKQVLLIGLGAGVSSGIIGTYPGVEQVTVVELNDEVPGGTEQFKQWNHDVIHNPKVKIIINDGANYVKATRKKYDFISSDPIHPFIAGNGTLYSADHWEICRERLNEGGVIAQWIPLYQLSPTDWATIIHTFTSVFPNSSLWYSGIDVVLVGFKGDVKVDPDRMAAKMSDPTIARDLLTMGVRSPGDVFGWFIAGPEQLQEMGTAAPINRVDRPVLEYTAPRALSLNGVSSTMPALLTAVERLFAGNPRRELNAMCTRALTSQELFDASTNQIACQWVMRAMILDSDGMPERYLHAMEHARAVRPHDQFIAQGLSEAQGRYASVLYDDDYRAALQLYEQAIANDPINVQVVIGGVQSALGLGDSQTARALLEAVPPSRREVFQVLIYQAIVAMGQQDYPRARRCYEAAEKHGQESPEMHIGLGVLDLRDGKRETARRHLARALGVATGSTQALYNLLTLARAHGQSAAVREYAEVMVGEATGAIAGNPTSRLFYDYRALAYDILGEQALAERDRTTASSLTGWWQGSELAPIARPST